MMECVSYYTLCQLHKVVVLLKGEYLKTVQSILHMIHLLNLQYNVPLTRDTSAIAKSVAFSVMLLVAIITLHGHSSLPTGSRQM